MLALNEDSGVSAVSVDAVKDVPFCWWRIWRKLRLSAKLCVSACLQMRSVASWLAFLLDVSADPGSPCLSLADSSWSSSAGLMLCELPTVGEEKEEREVIIHYLQSKTSASCLWFPHHFLASLSSSTSSAAVHRVPSLLVCHGSCCHLYNLLLRIWDSPLFPLTLCLAGCELLISQRSL